MELQTAAVSYRLAELRRVARSLRLERRRLPARRGRGITSLRVALGRRLVARGDALLEGTGARAHAASR